MKQSPINFRVRFTGVLYPFDVLRLTHLLRSTGLGLAQAHQTAYRFADRRDVQQEYSFASRGDAEAFLEAARALGVVGEVLPA